MRIAPSSTLIAAYLLLPLHAQARVTQLVIQDGESPTFEGTSFGARGQYERVTGIAYGELDPSDPLNAGIVNIDRAPLNPNARVAYSVDFYILKPIDLTLGNGTIMYDVLNRGGKGVHSVINAGDGDNNPRLASHVGNGYLMNEGYVIVWSGWQGDVQPGNGRMLARLPVPTNGGSPIVGTAREEYIDDFGGGSNILVDLSYAASTLDPSMATLTVRERERDARQRPASLTWQYLNNRQILINRPSGFDLGAIYEFIYPAQDPTVMGIGFAAVRDVVSFLRYETADDTGTPNPLAPFGFPMMQYTQACGISQSGRFLRDFIYQGFNQDEAQRRVFDGVNPVIAGGRRTFTNYAFAQPGATHRQHGNHTFPGDQFPFSYATTTDPISGRTDGLLAQCTSSGTCPLIMQTDSSTELWEGRSSLNVTNTSGSDIALPSNARMYLFAGAQHGPSGSPARGICQQLDNPLDWTPLLRAVTAALHQWVVDGTQPPDSRFPSRASGTLVASAQSSTGWPTLRGVTYNGLFNSLRLLDFGTLPPGEGAAYPVFVERYTADGNSMAGIRHPYLTVPDATYAGWNLRGPGQSPGELCDLTGSYIPFYRTRAQRMAAGDPRLSLQERYTNHRAYVNAVTQAANQLVTDRLMLPDDAMITIWQADARPIP